jgi:hypothetical protein
LEFSLSLPQARSERTQRNTERKKEKEKKEREQREQRDTERKQTENSQAPSRRAFATELWRDQSRRKNVGRIEDWVFLPQLPV